MGRLSMILNMLLFIQGIASATPWIQYNRDSKTINQVYANTALIEGTERVHISELEKIKEKQLKLSAETLALYGLKELQMNTRKNSSGFGRESAMYKSIAKYGVRISENAARAYTSLGKAKFMNQALGAIKIAELVSKAVSLANFYTSVVTNATAVNPFIGVVEGAEKGQRDKHNYLNRLERIKLAYTIISDLRTINYKLLKIAWACESGSKASLWKAIDRKTYYKFLSGEDKIDRIKKSWSKLTK